MRQMGGLRTKMPRTFWSFLAGGLALSGFPLITAGFWSKDEILSGAFLGSHMAVFIMLALAALLTAFYTARQITMVFFGAPRSESAKHASETKPVMTTPLLILAFFAITLGWVGIPKEFPILGSLSPAWFQTFMGQMVEGAEAHGHSLIPLLTSLVVSLGGLTLGWLVYRGFHRADQQDPMEKGLGFFFKVFQNKYWVDEFYEVAFIRPAGWFAEKFSYQFVDQTLIDGALHGIARLATGLGRLFRFGFDLPVVNGAGDGVAGGTKGLGGLMRRMQNGKVQHYMGLAVLFIVLITIVVIYFTQI
jgi:NADH-quinone oxidoreductase subunit L